MGRDPLTAGRLTWTAMLGASLMLAHQVAAKAVRDSFFLTLYPVTDLPKMVMSAAAASVILVLVFGRAMSRVGPQRLVPVCFAISALGHGAEFLLSSRSPGLTAVIVYLHVVALGAILLSGFWSLVNESFDPRSAKLSFGKITGAGTLGGMAGGVLAERVAALFSQLDVLLLLATLHALCAIVAATFRRVSPVREAAPQEPVSPIELVRRAPYMLSIAALVLLGTSSAAIADYLFKSGATEAFGKGAPLLRFFAVFYTATQVLTFLAQITMSRRALKKFGIGRTISLLPGGLGAASFGALLFPAFPVLTGLRSLELVLRGSFFRTAYELVYTPVRQADKRAAKSWIDVGCDRTGDAIGAGIVQLALLLGASYLTSGLLGIVLVLSALAAWLGSRLESVYKGIVEERLIDRAMELELRGIEGDPEVSSELLQSAILKPSPQAVVPVPAPAELPAPKATDATLELLRKLRSGRKELVLEAIHTVQTPEPLIATQLVRLLAWDEVADVARETISGNCNHLCGLLIDHLTNTEGALFAVRRRIPRILARSDSQMAVYGLLEGLHDSRFEVRFQCSRALDLLHQRNPQLEVSADVVFAAAERELKTGRPILESRRLLDRREISDPTAFLDEYLRERADQSLEYIFSLFATVLPREPVKIAFQALHSDDQSLRGLAFEYLEGVLPPHVWEGLWNVTEQKPVVAQARPPEEALAELFRSRESLLLRIGEIQRPKSS